MATTDELAYIVESDRRMTRRIIPPSATYCETSVQFLRWLRCL